MQTPSGELADTFTDDGVAVGRHPEHRGDLSR
jgi:hypothetical protein